MKKNVMKGVIIIATIFFFFNDAMSKNKESQKVSSQIIEYSALVDKTVKGEKVDISKMSTLSDNINCQLTKKQSESAGIKDFSSIRARSCGSESFPEKATFTDIEVDKYKASLKKLMNFYTPSNTPIKTQTGSKKELVKGKQIVIEIPNKEGGMEGIAIALNSNLEASSWEDAKAKCDTLRFGSSQAGNILDDWRLPNKEELCIIYNYFKKHPDNFKAGKEYWSSESGRRPGFYFSVQFWTTDLPCQPVQNEGKTNLEIMPIRVYNNIQDGD